MRVVRCTAPTHPDNCLNIIFVSRTFFISKLPHKVGTFRRMGEQESATLYRTHVHILLGLMQPLTAGRFSDIHVPEKITSTLSLPPSLVEVNLPPLLTHPFPLPPTLLSSISPSIPSLHLSLTHPLPPSPFFLPPPTHPTPPSSLNPPIDPRTDPSHSPPAG